MDTDDGNSRSHLFLVRVWSTPPGAADVRWAGKVQLVTSNEAGYFQGWSDLIAVLEAQLMALEHTPPAADSNRQLHATRIDPS